jgi:hypothetical protein
MGEEKETGNEGESVLSEVTCDSSTSSAGFGINEYSDIYPPTQPAITESQLLTRSLIPKKQRSRGPCPKSLSLHPNPCPCMFIVVFMLLIDSSEYLLLLLKYKK